MAGRRFGQTFQEQESPDPLPLPKVLRHLLSTCYQASLMREEDRPVVFRMLLREWARLPQAGGLTDGLHRLIFAQPLPFTANELRRIAPAASFERALIGVQLDIQGQPEIWGLVHSGAGWVRAQEGSRSGLSPLPSSLVIAASGPGRLTVARGSFTIVRLQGGRIVPPSVSLLETDHQLPEGAAVANGLMQKHENARKIADQPWARLTQVFPRQLRQQIALRVVSAIRKARHGGTVLFVGSDLATDRDLLSRYVRLKYFFQSEEPRIRAQTLILQAMKALAEVSGVSHPPPATVGWNEYVASEHSRVVAADESISELSRFLAGLTAVDGAVVMTHSLELLGFGGEISGDLPDVDVVACMVDLETREVHLEPATAFGTRHRSAYRLCKALPGSMALVISQDGGFRVVTCVENQVMCYEQITAGVLDL